MGYDEFDCPEPAEEREFEEREEGILPDLRILSTTRTAKIKAPVPRIRSPTELS